MGGFREMFEAYGADYHSTMARFMGNEAMYMKFLDMLFKDDNLEKLGEALEKQDYEEAFSATPFSVWAACSVSLRSFSSTALESFSKVSSSRNFFKNFIYIFSILANRVRLPSMSILILFFNSCNSMPLLFSASRSVFHNIFPSSAFLCPIKGLVRPLIQSPETVSFLLSGSAYTYGKSQFRILAGNGVGK